LPVSERAIPIARGGFFKSGICLLAGVGLIAVLAPAGAAASARQRAPSAKGFSSVAENYTIRYYPRFMTYFQQSVGALNQIVGPTVSAPCTASSYPSTSHPLRELLPRHV